MRPRRDDIVVPGPGQESVWDYPRPPRVEPADARIVLRLGGLVIADTTDAVRVLEASHPAWFYPNPGPGYAELADRIAVRPGRVDECTVDGERVHPQAGGFYGGWITSHVVGPFKGEPGSLGW